MTALDTNVLVRLYADDDPEQVEKARSVVNAGPCLVSDTVLLEFAWVIGSSYNATHEQMYDAIEALLHVPNMHFTDRRRIRQALEGMKGGLQAADVFHRASAEDAERVVTFDCEFARKAKGVPGVPVEVL